jgi:hypothetical protein
MMWRFSGRMLLPVGVVLLVAATAGRPQAQGTSGAERTADVVTVDFMAVTSDGRPIDDLQASEVTVRVDGRTRPLRSLQYVQIGSATVLDDGAGAPMPFPYGRNDAGSDGRLFYLVIDDDSFRAGREGPLREAVDRFTRALSPRDRLALVTMPYGGVKVPPTADHARVRTALNTIVGQAPASESGSDFACRTRRTLETLVGLLDTFGVGEAPRTLIFVSSGLAGPRRDNAPMLAPGMCELTVDLFRQVGVAAGAARAQFYLVMPEDVAVRPGVNRPQNIAGIGAESDNPFEGLENLAGVTGAHRMYLTGLPETALGRIARETSGHYVASLAPNPSDRNRRNHQVQIRVARPGVVVRSRPEIRFADARGPAAPTSVREMVSSRGAFVDLPLRVATYTSQDGEPNKVKVVAIVDSPDQGTKIATLAAVLFDGSGHPAAQWIGSGGDIAGPPVTVGLLAEPGLYRLRVAAIDALGRGGAVDWEVDATLTRAGPLRLSSVMLGLSREGAFIPRLQFGGEPVAIGYVEIYGGATGMRVTAALEVARTLNGPAILAVPLALSQGDHRHIATGAVPIGALPDGDYAVRAIIGVEGQPAGRVTQTLRKGKH